MKKFCQNIIVSLDFFPYPITVLFLSKNTISTGVSIVSSWVFFAILLASFSKSDIWLKRNPKITDQMIDAGTAILNLNNDNFALNIWLWDNDMYYTNLDPSYGKIEVIVKKYSVKDKDFIRESLSLTNCTNNESLGAWCLVDDEISINVTEAMWNGEFSFLDVQLNYCSNETSPTPCQPLEVMQEFFRAKFFSYSMKEYVFNFGNYDSPAKINTGNSRDFIINPDIYQFLSLSLMQVLLYQDSNPIFDNGEELKETYSQMDPSQLYSEIYLRDHEKDLSIDLPFANNTLVEVEFFPNRSKRKVIRKYETLIDTLSNLGGLASFLRVIGFLISSLTAKAKILRQLHKYIYSAASYPSPENLEIENEQANIEVKDNLCGNSIEMSLRNKNDIDAYHIGEQPKESPNFIRNSTKQLQTKTIGKVVTQNLDTIGKNQNIVMSVSDFFLFKFHTMIKKEPNPKEKVIAEIEKAYLKDFDILNVLMRLKNLELLKFAIFNEQERKLFEIIEGKHFSLKEVSKLHKNDMEMTLKYYEERQSEFKLSEREMRLWEIYQTGKF